MLNKIKNLFYSLKNLSNNFSTLIAVWLIVPIVILAGFGMYSVIKHGYAFHFSIVLLISTLLLIIPLVINERKNKKDSNPESKQYVSRDFVTPSSDWSNKELEIWNNSKQEISELLLMNDEWSNLDQHGLKIAESVSKQFGKKELEFTIPEGLKLLEEVSCRYRKTLNKMAPGIDVIKVSQVKWVFNKKEKYADGKLVKLGKWSFNLYRVCRTANPVTAALAELRSKAISLFTDNIQQNIKQALLQEVVSVCIDLYSERFSIDTENVMPSKASHRDEINEAPALEPLRVVIVGQTSSGKSSLINNLKGDFSAEVNALPTQTEVKTYSCKIDGVEELRLVDLPGLDGDEDTQSQIMSEMVEADLVLWVLKASQSSKKLDCDLHDKFKEYYAHSTNISRKPAKIIGVVNQVDKLKPTTEWSPPYDLINPVSAKEKVIVAATDYNKRLFTFDKFIPLAIPNDKEHFGVDLIENLIIDSHNEGKNTQLSRQRFEAKGRDKTLINQSRRLFKGAPNLVKNII